MGECGCGDLITPYIFRLGERFVLVEEMPYCEFCDIGTQICITEVRKEDLDSFDAPESVKISKLSVWADSEDKTKPFVLNVLELDGIKEEITRKAIEDTFDALYNKLNTEDKSLIKLKNIKDEEWDLIREVFIDEFNNIMGVSADSSQP